MKKTFFFLLLIIQIFQVKAQNKDLNYFIHEGLHNSPLLKEYQNKERRSKLDSMNVAAGAGFQVMAGSNNSYAPVINGWGYDEVKTDKANVSALLSVSKELTGAQNRRKRYESIALQNQSDKNAGKISEQELKKNITEQYIAAYYSEQQYLFNQDMLKLLDKEEILLSRLTQTGTYKQTDYLSFCVSQRQQKILVKSLKNQYDYDYFTLCWLCGVQDNSIFPLSDPELKAEHLPDLSSSVFYHQFVLDSLKIQNEKELVDMAYRPKLSAYADAGYLSSLAYKPGRNFGTSAGFTISIPIYDGGQKGIQHKQLSLDEQDRSNYSNFYKSQYQQQINNLWKRLDANREMSGQITEQIAYIQTLMEADHKLLESGDLHIAEYIVAMGNYLNAKNLLIQNTIDKYQIINELNYWNRTK
ncbi:MAG: TolC family protein [Bacteroidales bacterium]